MYNSIILTRPESIIQLLSDTFRSYHFSNNMYTHPWLRGIIDKFAESPKIFCDYTDQSIEHSHFYAWFGIIPYREYSNPVIHDLYLLHEIYHAGTMTYNPDASHEEWARKIKENELQASLISEAMVYYMFPKLRKDSFSFEIWWDRFKDVNMAEKDMLDYLESSRRLAYTIPKDAIEEEIALYKDSNDIWVGVWKERRSIVETMMVKKQNYHPGDQGRFVLDTLLDYTTDGIPFKEEALKFKEELAKLKNATQIK